MEIGDIVGSNGGHFVDWCAVLQLRHNRLKAFMRSERLRVCFCFFCEARQPRFKRLNIGENKLGIDRFNIALWIDAIFYMNNIAVRKCAYNMHNCVAISYICEKFIS